MQTKLALARAALIAVLTLANAASLQAQQALDALLAQADSANPRIAATRRTAEAARARVPQAGALPDPMLGVGFMNVPVRSWVRLPAGSSRCPPQHSELGRTVKKTALAALVLAASPVALSAQLGGPSWTNPREPVQIADDLYYVGTEDLSSYLFTSDAGHVLIDAPLDENVPQILANIRSLGFDPADVRIQLASHAHLDHVGGLATMGRATGAQLLISEPDAPYVMQGKDFGLDGMTNGYPAAPVARTFRDMETIRLGDIALTAHLTPGHTPGCTSWGGTVRIQGEPYDFVSVCSLSVLGNYELGGDEPTYRGQARDYCTSVAHLEGLDPDIFLGAHGSWFGIDDKQARREAGDAHAFVERGMYREYLAQARASIERALSRAGLTGGCAALVGR